MFPVYLVKKGGEVQLINALLEKEIMESANNMVLKQHVQEIPFNGYKKYAYASCIFFAKIIICIWKMIE